MVLHSSRFTVPLAAAAGGFEAGLVSFLLALSLEPGFVVESSFLLLEEVTEGWTPERAENNNCNRVIDSPSSIERLMVNNVGRVSGGKRMREYT